MDQQESTRIINTVPDATVRKALQELSEAEQILRSALSGDMVLHISPTTVDRTAVTAAWTRTVTLTLKNAAGKVHDWCNLALASKASIGNTSTAGTASIVSTTVTFVKGVCSIVVTGSAHAWVADETDTLTIANLTINGNTVTGGTSVQTFVAA
jgi:DNA-binding GntR family transcriptional regulator